MCVCVCVYVCVVFEESDIIRSVLKNVWIFFNIYKCAETDTDIHVFSTQNSTLLGLFHVAYFMVQTALPIGNRRKINLM